MKKIAYILFFLFSLSSIHAQVTIHGKATHYPGNEIHAYGYEDFISYKLRLLGSATIQPDGNFELKFDMPEKTIQFKLVVDGAEAIMYADDKAEYFVQIPPPEKKNENLARKKIEIYFDTLPIYDINNLILDFNSRVDEFIAYNFNILAGPDYIPRLDTFKIYLSKVYKDVKHPYFDDYLAYSVAELEMLGPQSKTSAEIKKEGENYEIPKDIQIYRKYIYKHPIRYKHDKYMLFVMNMYSDLSKMLGTSQETKLARAINYHASPVLFNRLFQNDELLGNPQIRELAMIKCLSEEYYNKAFDGQNILIMLDSIKQTSAYPEHRLIANNVIENLTWLHVGTKAPGFNLYDQRDSLISLEKLKGKFVYLHFWSVKNTPSVTEMKLMVDLKKKYGWDIEIVSINIDEPASAMKDFLRKNPTYNWKFLHYGNDKSVREKYKVMNLPQYFLIDPEGTLIQSPAYRPTPNGTFMTIDRTFWDIQKKLHPQKKVRVGQKGEGDE